MEFRIATSHASSSSSSSSSPSPSPSPSSSSPSFSASSKLGWIRPFKDAKRLISRTSRSFLTALWSIPHRPGRRARNGVGAEKRECKAIPSTEPVLIAGPRLLETDFDQPSFCQDSFKSYVDSFYEASDGGSSDCRRTSAGSFDCALDSSACSKDNDNNNNKKNNNNNNESTEGRAWLEDGLQHSSGGGSQGRRCSAVSESDISSASDLLKILMDEDGQSNASLPSSSGRNQALGTWLIDKDEIEIGEVIAHGSSGVIYKGMYGGQKAAIKVLKGFWKGRGAVEREFRREVLGLISCAHKNVLKLYGICIDPHHGVCIVTKFMEGGSLQQFLQKRQRLQINEIASLALDIAKGMRFLHSRGIVHMDLKSPNVLLDVDKEGKKIAVIGDLGVCHRSQETKTNQQIGSYCWMAPEVFGSNSDTADFFITPKSDVYSFGIVLWELVTCNMPYMDYTPLQAAVGVMMHGLRPVIPTDCYPPLKYLMEKCWAQNPCDRPDFTDVVSMLRIILRN